MKRIWYGLAMVIALAAGGIGYHYGTSGGDGAGLFNVFVATNGNDSGGNCVRYSTARDFPGGTVCASLSRAYALAQRGDKVQVRDGSYGAQDISYDANKVSGSGRVEFDAQDSLQAVFTGGIAMAGAQHLEFVRLKISATPGTAADYGGTAYNRDDPGSPKMTDVVFRDGYLQNFNFASCDGCQILNSEVGNYSYADGFSSNNVFGDSQGDTTNFVFSGNLVHNIYENGATSHAECMFLKAVDGATITNNKMIGCPGVAIAGYDSSTGHMRNVTIMNNWLTCQDSGPDGDTCYGGGNSIQFDTKGNEEFTNITVAFNNGPGSMGILGATSALVSNAKYYGNVGGTSCTGNGITADYNVGNSCGGTNSATAAGVVNSDYVNYDGHIGNGGQIQDNFVPASFCATNTCPSTDIDGGARPHDSAYDAGSDER